MRGRNVMRSKALRSLPAISAKAAALRLRSRHGLELERVGQFAGRSDTARRFSDDCLRPAHRNSVLTKVLSMEASVGRPVAAMA